MSAAQPCSVFVLNLGGCSSCTEVLVRLFSDMREVSCTTYQRVLTPALADVVLVTGYLSKRNAGLLEALREALPKGVPAVAMGSCACRAGAFGKEGTLLGPIESYLPVTLRVEGCPPPMPALVDAISKATNRRCG